MTQEEKELLLKDLSARLPYHVKVKVWLKDGTTEEGILDLEHNYGDVLRDAFYYNKIVDIKPYLRPMSSMNEKELYEYFSFVFKEYDGYLNDDTPDFTGNHFVYIEDVNPFIDWLNKNYFDYRGLIPKGLAIEVTKDNNPYEN